MADERRADDDHLISAAREALQHRTPSHAIVHLSQLLRHSVNHPEAWEMMGVACAMAGDRRRARSAFEEATRRDPRRVSGHFNYALFLAATGDLELAAEHNAAALYLAPDHAAAHALQGRLAARLRDRQRTSDQGFRIVQPDAEGVRRPSTRWANLECPVCGGSNFPTARVCRHCGQYIQEMPDVVPAE